jgi:hypothetical protein
MTRLVKQYSYEDNKKYTSNVVIEWFTPLLRIREVPGSNSAPRTAILTEIFRSFPQSLQENAGVVP